MGEPNNLKFYKYKQIGYHGNETVRIKKFLDKKEFCISCRLYEYLGTGVYFFERDIGQAIDWCTKARNYREWSIIEANLEVEKMFDLGVRNNYNQFIDSLKKVRNRYKFLKKQGKLPKQWKEDIERKKLLNSIVLNMMYQYEPYDAVKAIFPVEGRNTGKPERLERDMTNIQAMQIQICIKNQNCIVNFEEVDL